MTPLTVTLDRAAEITGLSVRTCRRRCEDGTWSSFVDGRTLVVYESLMEWMHSRAGIQPNAA